MSDVAFVLLSLALGWGALFPARRSFGTAGYHLLALPTGLLAWLGAAVFAAATGAPFVPKVVLPAAFATAGAIALALSPGRERRAPAPSPLSYAFASAAAGGVSAWAVVLGGALYSYDSYAHWELAGLWFRETSRLTPDIMAGRSLLVPAWHAAHRTLGGSWLHAIDPALAAVALGALAWALWRLAPASLRPLPRAAAALAPPLLLAMSAPFRIHALYVHTHMASAVYLLLSLAALAMARALPAEDLASRRAWLIAAGLCAAGLALARPDGPAYATVPVLVALAVAWERSWRGRDVALFAAALLVPMWLHYGVGFLRLGLWSVGRKLSGRKALAVLAALTALPALGRAAGLLAPVRRAFARPGVALAVFAAAEATFLGAWMATRWEEARPVVGAMVVNMLREGSQGSAWYVAAAVVAAGVLLGATRRRSPFAQYALFAVAQFFVVGLAVHVSSHGGRPGFGDSFNRVSFHALPLVFWCLGALMTGALASVAAAEQVQRKRRSGGGGTISSSASLGEE